MIKIITSVLRMLRFVTNRLQLLYLVSLLKLKKVQYQGIQIQGLPKIKISKNTKVIFGNNFKINSGYSGNLIGRQQKTIISVSDKAKLIIGNNVGISSSAIICTKKIVIGNNVRIGGNTCIYDTDFHSLITEERIAIPEITINVKKREVTISDNVFIGAHSTILKGVTIGANSIIGACSVVTKNIPANEVWAGNPAKFIKPVE